MDENQLVSIAFTAIATVAMLRYNVHVHYSVFESAAVADVQCCCMHDRIEI